MTRFSDEEVRRYARQMVLPEVGGIGQARLRAATATAHGELEALYLAAAGVGTIRVRSTATAEAVRALNPLVRPIVDENENENENDDVEAGALRAVETLKEILGL